MRLKQVYGSWLLRALRGGTRLLPGEYRLLAAMVQPLPPHLREVAESQFAEYNLVQREVDGRALNFYRVRPFSMTLSNVTRLLPMQMAEAPVIRIAAEWRGCETIHATLTAVSGRIFCAAFDRPVPSGSPEGFEVTHVVQVWRSNFPA